MKKTKRQNIIFAAIAAIIIGGVVAYGYSAEQTRQSGFVFGNELAQIQEDVNRLQMDFNPKLTQWDEGDLQKKELLGHAESHLKELEGVMGRYDILSPPAQFSAAVELFKLSTASQLQSDMHYTEWIRTGQDSERIRSDALLQESFDYELLALGEFNRAKAGYKEYDGEPAKFEPPDKDITLKVNRIWENMREECDAGMPDAASCIATADAWRAEHLP